MDHHVFLSYASQDAALMEQIRAEFHKANMSVWTMGNIAPGTPSWKRAIESAIKNAGCLVAILSPDAYESDWVREELEFAKLQQLPLYIILARGEERNVIPFGFSVFQLTDIRTDIGNLNRLIATITTQLKVSPTIESTPTTTRSIWVLVTDVLRQLPQPYGEDVIEDVFLEIERKREWLDRYSELTAKHGKHVVNKMIGWYTKETTGYQTLKVVSSRRSNLAGSYSKLKPNGPAETGKS